MLDCQSQLSIFLVFCEAKKNMRFKATIVLCAIEPWKACIWNQICQRKKTLWKMVEHFGYPDSEKECSEMASVIF